MTSLVATVSVARSVDAQSFGLFALGFVAYTTVLGIARALVMQPLAIRHSTSTSDQHNAMRASATAALGIGAGACVVALAIGAVAGGEATTVLAVVGVCLPGMMLQDLYRFVSFALGVPGRAAVNDLVWLIAQILLTAAMLAAGAGVAALTAAWGGAGGIAAALGIAQTRVRPGPGAAAFVCRHRDLGATFAAEFVLLRGVAYAVVVCLVPIVGVAAVGGLRAVMTLYGPYTTLAFGTTAAALSEGSRLLARRPEHFVRWQRLMGLGLAACATLWAGVLLAMPSAWGRAILGDSWAYAEPLILPVSANQIALGVGAGALMGLRLLGAGLSIVRLRVVAGAATLGLGMLGAVRGIVPAAWGMAAANCILAVMATRAVGRRPPVSSSPPARAITGTIAASTPDGTGATASSSTRDEMIERPGSGEPS